MVASVTPPDTSVRMGPGASMCATAMASTTVPGSMLSSSTASAPARAASATWSSASHSISTIRPGHSARDRLTASAMLVPARWLSFTRTASDSPERWLVPPPARTAAFSRTRRPGVVLRVSSTATDGLLSCAAATNCAVSVATPDSRPRKLSAVRSAVRIGRSGPVTSSTVSPAASSSPSPASHTSSTSGPTRRKVSVTHAAPARTPARRARSAKCARTCSGTRAAVRSPSGPRSSARARPTASPTARAYVSSSSPTAPPLRDGGAAVHQPPPPRRVGGGVLDPGVGAPALGAGQARRPTARPPPAAGWPAPRRATEAVASPSTEAASSTTARAPANDSALRTTPAPRVMARCTVSRHLVTSTPGNPSGAGGAPPAGGARTVHPMPSIGSSPSTARSAPLGSGLRAPDGMRSASRAPKTMPSSSELEANRLAPCTPVQATSPTAHSPGSAVAPHRSATTPPDR